MPLFFLDADVIYSGMTYKHSDEQEKLRLDTLRDLKILDTPVEDRFERITRKVCQALNLPIAAISLIDSDRQWFKSAQGVSVSETHRSLSFCNHTIKEAESMVVPDATKDARFCNNDLVTGDPSIRFYAGVPLKAPNGVKIGALCAIDSKPRHLSEYEHKILRDLADQVEAELKE